MKGDETVKVTDVTGKAVEEIERTKYQLQNLGRSINIIIRDSVAAVKEGKLVADSTAAEFENVVGIIHRVDNEVESVAKMVRENVSAVSRAVDEIDKIETVVDQNVQIAQNSKQVSAEIVGIAGQLMELVQD